MEEMSPEPEHITSLSREYDALVLLQQNSVATEACGHFQSRFPDLIWTSLPPSCDFTCSASSSVQFQNGVGY